jgi:hypothetical protein
MRKCDKSVFSFRNNLWQHIEEELAGYSNDSNLATAQWRRVIVQSIIDRLHNHAKDVFVSTDPNHSLYRGKRGERYKQVKAVIELLRAERKAREGGGTVLIS